MDKIHELFQGATSIVIFADKVENADRANSIIAITKYLQEIGKAVGVVIKENPSKKIRQIFKDNNVVFSNSTTPLRYVVSIDYGSSGVETVLHDVDEKNHKVNFFIVPSAKNFDFDDVEYSKEGNQYDLTMTLGVKSFRDLGELYNKNENLFKDNAVISIADGIESLGDHFIAVKNGKTYSSAVHELLQNKMTDEIEKLLLGVMIDEVRILEGGVTPEQIEQLCKAVKSGTDINYLISQKYFSKSYPNLDLQIKLMHNIKIDKSARVIWSVVSNDDLKFAGVTRETLDTKGRIIFNISSEFDIAVAAYEVEPGKLKVIVESNKTGKYSASKIAGVFGGKGDNAHANMVLNDTTAIQFEKKFFPVLSELYSLEIHASTVPFTSAPVSVDKEPANNDKIDESKQESLTGSQKDDKNSSQQEISSSTPNEDSDLLD